MNVDSFSSFCCLCNLSLSEDSKRSGFMNEVVRKRNAHCSRPSDVPLDLLVRRTNHANITLVKTRKCSVDSE